MLGIRRLTGAVDAMTEVPANPKVYHITHLRNLPRIVKTGMLWSDAKRIELGIDCRIVGMSRIKQRRLSEIDVDCHPDSKVGDYVPFYFCPRSIMLYILHMGNHPDLDYNEGQCPIVHLKADLHAVVDWAELHGRHWAFSDCNAGAYYANFYADLTQLDQLNWTAVNATDFRDSIIMDGKQAEFLLHESFPWELVEEIGVYDAKTAEAAERAIEGSAHPSPVRVERSWYY